jgi:hypothetical protein
MLGNLAVPFPDPVIYIVQIANIPVNRSFVGLVVRWGKAQGEEVQWFAKHALLG